jgi:hypothetical protein
MENNVDNNSELNYTQFISFAKSYFEKHYSAYLHEREYFDPKGYWGIYFVNDPVELLLGSERSFFVFQLKRNGKLINVSEIDSRIKLLERTSEKNVIFLLDILKGVL